jgi:hypothetical protein
MQMHINTNPFLRPRYARFLTTAIMLGVGFLWYSLVLAEALQDQSRFYPRNFGLYAQSTRNLTHAILIDNPSGEKCYGEREETIAAWSTNGT